MDKGYSETLDRDWERKPVTAGITATAASAALILLLWHYVPFLAILLAGALIMGGFGDFPPKYVPFR